MSSQTKAIINSKIQYKSPSNIAFIKYWGKRHRQLPMNASLSMTLTHCHTITEVEFVYSENGFYLNQFFLDDILNLKFKNRAENFIDSIKDEIPFVNKYKLNIRTTNSFPHSAGIASSASGMSALVMCLLKMEAKLNQTEIDLQKASRLSRLASGSAARSIFPNFVRWGKTADTDNFSEDFAEEIVSLNSFPKLMDTIAIVSKTEKTVSSSHGHSLMNAHPFAEARFKQANDNLKDMLSAMHENDLSLFGEILELEALTLHGLMLSSSPSFVLLEPNSIAIINEIRHFRESSKLPLFFTIDAGPNIHMIYPESIKEEVKPFFENSILPLSLKLIEDIQGTGPELLSEVYE